MSLEIATRVLVAIAIAIHIVSMLAFVVVWCLIPNGRTRCQNITRYGTIMIISADEQYDLTISSDLPLNGSIVYHISNYRVRHIILWTIYHTVRAIVAIIYCLSGIIAIAASATRGVSYGYAVDNHGHGVGVGLGYGFASAVMCLAIMAAKDIEPNCYTYNVAGFSFPTYHSVTRFMSCAYIVLGLLISIADGAYIALLVSMLF